LLFIFFILFSIAFSSIISVSAYVYAHKGLESVPCTVYLSNTLSSPAQARCRDAMTTWNETCFSYDCLVYGGTNNVASCSVEDDMNTVSFVNNMDTYLAETHITKKKYTFLWLDWYVVEFDININPDYEWYTNISETAISLAQYDGHVDLESVMLHEYGHALGLDHTEYEYYNGQRVVMYSYVPEQTIIRALSEDDRLGIVELY